MPPKPPMDWACRGSKKGTGLRTVPHTCTYFLKYNSPAIDRSLLCQGRVLPSQEGVRPETDRTAPCRTPPQRLQAPPQYRTTRRSAWKGEGASDIGLSDANRPHRYLSFVTAHRRSSRDFGFSQKNKKIERRPRYLTWARRTVSLAKHDGKHRHNNKSSCVEQAGRKYYLRPVFFILSKFDSLHKKLLTS